MLTALVWKEFREHLFKAILFLILWVALFPLLAFLIGGIAHAAFYLTLFVAPIWLATSTITSEKSRHTAAMLSTLPVSPLTVFIIKTACGVATCGVPLFLVLGVVLLIARTNQSLRIEDLQYLCALALFIMGLYFLILAVGMTIVREGTVAMVGILVLLASGLWSALMQSSSSDWTSLSPIVRSILNIPNPAALLVHASQSFDKSPFSYALITQLAVTALYWLIAAIRYCRTTTKASPSTQAPRAPATRTDMSSFDCSILQHPLLWKEFREQAILLFATAITGVLLAVFFTVAQSNDVSAPPEVSWISFHHLLAAMLIMSVFVPAVVACILGFSAMSGDLSPQLADFWQSRPINAAYMFWAKYGFAFLGVVSLAIFFATPYSLLSPLIQARFPHVDKDTGYSVASLLMRETAIIPLAFSLATCCALLFRRTIYGVALGVLLLLGLMFVPFQGPTTAGAILFGDYLPQYMPTIMSVVLALAIVFTLLARFAFVRR